MLHLLLVSLDIRHHNHLPKQVLLLLMEVQHLSQVLILKPMLYHLQLHQVMGSSRTTVVLMPSLLHIQLMIMGWLLLHLFLLPRLLLSQMELPKHLLQASRVRERC